MSSRGNDEERGWAADKRDFVADARDHAADQRDTAADSRDAIADARETAADAREAALSRREQHLHHGTTPPGSAAPVEPTAEAQAERERARHSRDEMGLERQARKVTRDAETARRLADAGPTRLAMEFAGIAEHLYDAGTYDEVLTRIAQVAVATVNGGDSASVTLREDGGYRTAGPTDRAATAVDQAQYEADQGPCLDALNVAVVHVSSFPDERWPALGARPNDHGVHSSVSYHVDTSGREGASSGKGSLNIYGLTPAAFDQAARDTGLVLAAHASLAARAVSERSNMEGHRRHLHQALLSRDVIGQAKGILMERLKITPETAFDILKDTSQRLNVKLHEVAHQLTLTGDVADRYQPAPVHRSTDRA